MLKIIMTDIGQNMEFLPLSVLAGGLFLLCTILVRRYREKKNEGTGRMIHTDVFRAFFLGFFVLMAQIVFLSREPGSRNSLDLLPGLTWTNDLQGKAYVIENIILFFPFGFLLMTSFEKIKVWQSVLIGFFVSLLIETLQYCTGRGYCQTDDVIMNVLGTFFGSFLAYLVKRGCFLS